MGKMEDERIIDIAVKKKMSLQSEEGENYDTRCTLHPQGTICNWKQHAKALQDGDKTSRKMTQKETIYRDSYELAKCYLDTSS